MILHRKKTWSKRIGYTWVPRRCTDGTLRWLEYVTISRIWSSFDKEWWYEYTAIDRQPEPRGYHIIVQS